MARATVRGPNTLDCPTFPDIEIPDSRALDKGPCWPKNFPVKSDLLKEFDMEFWFLCAKRAQT